MPGGLMRIVRLKRTLPPRVAKRWVPLATAHPDSLLRSNRQDRVCGFLEESRMEFDNATNLDRKSGVPGMQMVCFRCFPRRAQPDLHLCLGTRAAYLM